MLHVRSILCDLNSYSIDGIRSHDECLQIDLGLKRRTAVCPTCKRCSRSVHSRYVRTLAHVPISLRRVRIRLLTRRFRCRNPTCRQRIFAERAEGLGRPYARTTESNRAVLQRIGNIVGCNPGQRLAGDIGVPTSATTLRRRILEMPMPEQQTVRILGVDDWAWRKGCRYGTILCDLEAGRIVDLLPDRSADSLAKWLKDHPGVEVISRDRATCYAEGSQQGAPDAVQVADRWHLLHNMTDAVEKVLRRHVKELKAAADSATADASGQSDPGTDNSICQGQEIGQTVERLVNESDGRRQTSKAERERLNRRAARAQRYDRVVELHGKGVSERGIMRETGMSRGTVRRYLSCKAFPEINSPENRRSQLDTYELLIRERLEANASTVKELLQELRGLGYSGSESSLARYIRRRLKWNKRMAKNREGEKPKCPSPRRVSIMMVQGPDKRAEQDGAFLVRLTSSCDELAAACCIAHDFADMIRQREPARYDAWRLQVKAANVPELMTFARVLDRDRDAVIAGLTLPWSNGPTEGHVNRLKSIKRQMYGRAGFEMLRRRVLVPP